MSNLELSRAQRLDQYVGQALPRISRAHAAKLVSSGLVSINGVVVNKPGYKMRGGEVVNIAYDEAELDLIPEISIPIVYEDDDCVVINKPTGLLTHSKGAFNPEATVATWLRQQLGEAAPALTKEALPVPLVDETGEPVRNERAGIVHRLDRATSGVMICAKTPEALAWLQKQFGQRRVKKTYLAIVAGQMAQPHAIIDMAIERNPKKPQTFRVGINGKSAVTEYRVVQTTDSLSLLELKPTTGRTHQLRVHLLQLGHPIVGDPLYAGQPAHRLFLHAAQLELTLPSRERRTFEVPMPTEFSTFLEAS